MMSVNLSTYEELQLRLMTPLPVPNDTRSRVPAVPYPSGAGQRTIPLPFSIPKRLVVKQNNPIRMIVADDHQMVREGLVALLNRRPDMVVVGQAANGRELVELFLLHRPDVALVDLRMPELGGAEAIAEIREQIPEARAIVLTTYDDDEDIKRSFEAGAKAYLLKDTGRDELLACIKAVHEGGTLIPHGIAPKPR
ncbi:MAG: response regulator [Armatimonadota bacterium]